MADPTSTTLAPLTTTPLPDTGFFDEAKPWKALIFGLILLFSSLFLCVSIISAASKGKGDDDDGCETTCVVQKTKSDPCGGNGNGGGCGGGGGGGGKSKCKKQTVVCV